MLLIAAISFEAVAGRRHCLLHGSRHYTPFYVGLNYRR